MKLLIALLTAATAILHLLVGFDIVGGSGATNWILVLNGVGYLVLLWLFWTSSGSRRSTIRWILLVYALITLVGYFALNAMNGIDSFANPIGLIIKAIELLLIILLFLDRGSDRVAVTAPAPAATRTGAVVSSEAYQAASGVGAASSAAAIGAAAAVDRTTAEVDLGLGSTAATIDAELDEADYAIEEIEEEGEDVFDEAGDMLAETGDRIGDAATGAWVATGAAVAGAAAWVGDKAEDAADATDDALDTAGDRVGHAVDATGDALAGAGAAVGAAVGGAVDEVRDFVGGEEEPAPAGELTAAELRTELEEYLRSFGSGSEFRKEIEYIEGIGPAYGAKLRGAGVATVLDLMIEGATRIGRKHLADRSGLTPSQILTWVNHIDLFRIKGVAQEYADLLEQSGVDTVVELAQRNPNNLFKRMNDINEQKKLVRRTPHLSDVQSWVEQAKNLKRLIHY